MCSESYASLMMIIIILLMIKRWRRQQQTHEISYCTQPHKFIFIWFRFSQIPLFNLLRWQWVASFLKMHLQGIRVQHCVLNEMIFMLFHNSLILWFSKFCLILHCLLCAAQIFMTHMLESTQFNSSVPNQNDSISTAVRDLFDLQFTWIDKSLRVRIGLL